MIVKYEIHISPPVLAMSLAFINSTVFAIFWDQGVIVQVNTDGWVEKLIAVNSASS